MTPVLVFMSDRWYGWRRPHIGIPRMPGPPASLNILCMDMHKQAVGRSLNTDSQDPCNMSMAGVNTRNLCVTESYFAQSFDLYKPGAVNKHPATTLVVMFRTQADRSPENIRWIHCRVATALSDDHLVSLPVSMRFNVSVVCSLAMNSHFISPLTSQAR